MAIRTVFLFYEVSRIVHWVNAREWIEFHQDMRSYLSNFPMPELNYLSLLYCDLSLTKVKFTSIKVFFL